MDFLRLFKSKPQPLGFFYRTLELVGCMAHKVLTLSEAYGLMLRILSWNSGYGFRIFEWNYTKIL